jgi:hypothetical protein
MSETGARAGQQARAPTKKAGVITPASSIRLDGEAVI